MAHFFGTDEISFTIPNSLPDQIPAARQYARFSDVLDEVFLARIWGGLHYRNSLMAGEILSREVVVQLSGQFFQEDQGPRN